MQVKYISIAELCVRLDIRPTTAAKLVRTGAVNSRKLGGRRLICLESVQALMGEPTGGEM